MMQKNDLLNLLDDPDVHTKLIGIMTPHPSDTKQAQAEEKTETDAKKVIHLTEQLEEKEIEMLNLKGLLAKFKGAFSEQKEANTQLTQNVDGLTQDNQELAQTATKLNTEISQLNEDIKHKKLQLNTLQTRVNETEMALNKANQTLLSANTQNKTLNATVNDYKTKFDDGLGTFKRYNALSNDTKSSLKGIFKNDSFDGFMACGVQEKNISSLWEYIKSELIENTNADNDNLVHIFNFFFSRYQMAYPMYQAQDVSVGQDFNTDHHINAKSSVSGKIHTILLLGWINTKTNKIVKKSVVTF